MNIFKSLKCWFTTHSYSTPTVHTTTGFEWTCIKCGKTLQWDKN